MDLSALLERSTADVEPAPDLVARVVRGGRRRRARRRTGAALLAVVALVGVGGWAVSRLGPGPAPVRLAGPLFQGGTHGDLAGDGAYLSAALRAWDDSHASSGNVTRGIFDDLRGPARVVWAGQTPAGPAAVVAQDAYLHHHGDIQLDHEGIYQLLGFVGVDHGGAPTVVGDTYPDPDDFAFTAWFVDPGRTVLAVIDDGQAHGFSTGWTYAADGRATRELQPVPDHDGVGFTLVPNGEAASVGIAALPYRTFRDTVGINGAVQLSTEVPQTLDWTGHRLLAGADPAHARAGNAALFAALDPLREGEALQVRGARWWIAAGLPDGRQATVGEIGLDNDPGRLMLLLRAADGSTTVVDEGPIDAGSSLPVKVHLPDGQGWIVARYGATLHYPGGPTAQDAMLVPEGRTPVTVTVDGRAVGVDL